MNVVLTVLCLLSTFDRVLSECPNINDLDPLCNETNQFHCFWYWKGLGSSEPIDGCNGEWHTILDNFNFDAPEGKYISMGSIIVMAGCTLYAYKDHNYSGRLVKYKGPGVFPDGCNLEGKCPPPGSWRSGNGFHSFKCRCKQKPIICQPEDRWKTIDQCDNTQSRAEISCSYKKEIGTTWSEEAKESMSIHKTIEAKMQASFFEMFSAELGTSVTTGYDWSHVSTQAKSVIETYKVEAKVPPCKSFILAISSLMYDYI